MQTTFFFVVLAVVVVVCNAQTRPVIPTTFYAEVRVTYQVGQLGDEHESFTGGGIFILL